MNQGSENYNNKVHSTESPRSKTLLEYAMIVLKHRRMIFLVTVAVTLITACYIFLLPNIYSAKTLILPAQEDKGLTSLMLGQLGGLANIAGGAGVAIGGPTTADLFVSLIKSEAVKDPIVDRLNLLKIFNKEVRSDVYPLLDRNTAVSLGKKDGIITIIYSDKDPKFAAAMANAYVEELGNLAVRLNVAGAGQNRFFLEKRLTSAKMELLKAEEDLKSFQAKNKTVDVNAQAEATIKGIAELTAQLAAQEVQLATARRQFTDESQEVKNLVSSVNNLKAQIAKLEGTGGGGAIPSVGSAATIGQQYVRLMREFKIHESLVELLTKQYEMAKLSEAKDTSPFQIIQIAKVPERKVGPLRLKILIIAIVTCLIFTVLGSFVLEYLEYAIPNDFKHWTLIKNKLFISKVIGKDNQ
jgi:uncharacterized protein involved in exopolysaccharide biosynthesis